MTQDSAKFAKQFETFANVCLSQFILQVDASQVPRAPVAAGMGSDVDEAERCSSSFVSVM